MKFEIQDLAILKDFIKESVKEEFETHREKEFEKRIYNISETAKILKKSYNYVSNQIKSGNLKPTADGKHISGKEINRYLGE